MGNVRVDCRGYPGRPAMLSISADYRVDNSAATAIAQSVDRSKTGS
jgi:hypothetical protein